LRNAEDSEISTGLCGVVGEIAVVRKFTVYRKWDHRASAGYS